MAFREIKLDTDATQPIDGFRSLDESQVSLSSSQQLTDRLRVEAEQARQQATVAQAPTTIAKETVRGTLGAVFDPFIKAGRTAVQAVGEAFGAKEPIEEYTNIAGEPAQTLQKDVEEGKSVPRAMGEFGLEAATVAPIGKGISLAKQGIAKGVEAISKIPVSKIPIVSKVASFLEERAEKKLFQENLKFAQELTSRPITEAVAESAIKGGSEGYRLPKNPLKRAKVIPTIQDNRVAEATAPYLVKDSSAKGIQTNVDNLKQTITRTNFEVREMIANNKVPFNEKQLRVKLNLAKEDSKLLFAGDTASEKAYNAVVDEFVDFVNKGKKDTLGLFDSRQAFDRYIQKKFPNAFKKDATGQFLDPKDNIRTNALLDVRRAANEYVADLLPPNNPYFKALKDESYMIDAIGRIAKKNTEIFDKSRIQLLADEYPIINYIVGSSIIGGGMIAGGAILRSSD